MNDNPFISKAFTTTWLKYFMNDDEGLRFNSIEDATFVKNKYFPLFINVGRNFTNGMTYSFPKDLRVNDFKNKVFIIHDIPEYFDLKTNHRPSNLKLNKVSQYKGYLANITPFESFDFFLKKQFRSKRRNYLIKKQEQLEMCFSIKYSFLYGKISMTEYLDKVLSFKEVLSKRFHDLGLGNDVLINWDYYQELFYNMILDKKGLLFAIQRDGKPIGVAFSFLSALISAFAPVPAFTADFWAAFILKPW